MKLTVIAGMKTAPNDGCLRCPPLTPSPSPARGEGSRRSRAATSRVWRTLLAVLATLATAFLAVLPAPTFAGTPLPKTEIANPDSKCVAPPEEMRRNHMEMLKHQRGRTMREGIRGEAASLNECVNCHASKKTGSVHQEGEFCQSCHAYAAVKLDCFQCHQPKANFKSASAGTKP